MQPQEGPTQKQQLAELLKGASKKSQLVKAVKADTKPAPKAAPKKPAEVKNEQ